MMDLPTHRLRPAQQHSLLVRVLEQCPGLAAEARAACAVAPAAVPVYSAVAVAFWRHHRHTMAPPPIHQLRPAQRQSLILRALEQCPTLAAEARALCAMAPAHVLDLPTHLLGYIMLGASERAHAVCADSDILLGRDVRCATWHFTAD